MVEVLIIESRNADDYYTKRSEGKILAQVLQLGGYEAEYLEVTNLEYFEKAIEVGLTKSVRYVHFSGHGHKNCIELTDGTRINWRQLQKILQQKLLDKYLVFSSCKVAKGVQRLFEIDSTFCRAIVAPTRNISWGEGLVAYSAFYHRALRVVEKTDNSVVIMNSITKPETFSCFYNPIISL